MKLHWIVPIAAAMLTACTPPVTDACALAGRERVEAAMQAKLTRFELDPGIDNGKVSGSACLMDFDDGVFVRLSVEEFHDADYMANFRDEHWQANRAPVDQEASKMLGIAVHYDKTREALQADVAANRSVFINMDNYTKPAKTSVATERTMTTVRFERDKIADARNKAIALAKLMIPES